MNYTDSKKGGERKGGYAAANVFLFESGVGTAAGRAGGWVSDYSKYPFVR